MHSEAGLSYLPNGRHHDRGNRRERATERDHTQFRETVAGSRCLPIKLNLLTLVAQLLRELLDAGRQVQGRILLCKLEPLSREFEYWRWPILEANLMVKIVDAWGPGVRWDGGRECSRPGVTVWTWWLGHSWSNWPNLVFSTGRSGRSISVGVLILLPGLVVAPTITLWMPVESWCGRLTLDGRWSRIELTVDWNYQMMRFGEVPAVCRF